MFRKSATARDGRAAVAAAALRSFARSPQAVESLERRLMFAARIVGSSAVYATIQAAVDAATAGQTINVDAGVYSELVSVHKSVTIRGPRAGLDARSNLRNDRPAEAIVNGSLGAVTGLRSTAFFLNANNIVLDGFTVEGQNGTNTYNAGISIGAGRSGVQILNNIVQNNATGINVTNSNGANPAVIRGNLFRENNQSGPHTGRAIYSDGSVTGGVLDNVIIDNNVFFKNYGVDPNFAVQPAIGFEAQSATSIQRNIQITNNIFDYNGKGVLIYNASALTVANNVFTHNRDVTSANLRFEGGMTDVTVRDNLFYNSGGRAIRIDQKVIKSPNQNFAITNNNFFGNGRDAGAERTAIKVDTGTFTGTLNATGNWYGAAGGPAVNVSTATGKGDAIWTGGNSIDFSGWKTTPIATGATLDLPYFRLPLDATAPVMFVDFDHGGQGVSYSDTTSNNQGNILHRYQAVDQQATSDPGFGVSAGHQLAWVKAGEWIEYTVNIAAAGVYDLQVRLSNANTAASPGKFHLEVDGANVSGTITPATTGSNTAYVTQTIGNIVLPAGVHVLRFVFDTNGSTGYVANLHWFNFLVPTVTPPPPLAPSNLLASPASPTSVNVTWTDNADNETGFIIERSTDGIDWIEVGDATANATSYSDTSAAPSTQYFYRVRAENTGGDSDYSNIDDATTPAMPTVPAAPTGLSASASSSSQINLSWADNASDESGFIIERSLNGIDNWAQVGSAGENATSFSNTGVAASTQYFYRVRAVNIAGASADSNVANATTPAAPVSQTLVSPGSIWRYLDNGSNQGSAWRALGFSDGAWKSGAAQLGYGDGDEATVVSFGASSTAKFITTYFRKTFDVADASLVTALTLRLLRDDGAVVYLNGTEIFRSNMPTGTLAHTTRASSPIGNADEFAWLTATINPALLVNGANVLAVEIHQDSPSSSDISFDAELTAMLNGTPPAPTVPSAPTGLIAAAASPSLINLSWTDTASNETSFIIERSANGMDGWIEIGTKSANETSYSDSANINPATQYFYRVRAANEVGPSGNSNVASATTPALPTVPAAPSNLVASAISSTQINLSWTDNASDENGFVIERSLNGVDGWTPIGNAVANATTFSNTTGLAPATQYFYRVRAVNGVGPSANSNVASATTHTVTFNPTLIAPGSTWKYVDNGSNQGTAWRGLGFNDSAWKSGAGELGYGDGDETTVVSFGASSTNKFITTYFRKTFSVVDPAAIAALTMRLLRDDGVVVYLNGVEVYRNNMPTGTIGYTTRASSFIGGADETTWVTAPLSSAALVAGGNVIAVEIHQDSPSSSDVSFDLELTATPQTFAAGAVQQPPPKSTSSTFSTSLIGQITELA